MPYDRLLLRNQQKPSKILSVLPTWDRSGDEANPSSASSFPLVRQCSVTFRDPFELYRRITGCSPHSFFIEHDFYQPDGAHRFSYLGSDPYRVMKGKGHQVQIYHDNVWEEHWEDPFSWVERQLVQSTSFSGPTFLPFLGGAVGYLSYDLARTFEVLPEISDDDLLFPDVYLLFLETFVAIDHQTSLVWLVFSPSPERLANLHEEELTHEGHMRLSQLASRLQSQDPEWNSDSSLFSLSIREGQSASEYQDRVRECQRYIAAGDLYQANLSQRFQVEGLHDRCSSPAEAGGELYRQLRQLNPSPYSAFLVLESDVIICNSPERLVRLSHGYADMRPIAGTRPRGADTSEDRRLAEELLSSPKERAEHLMLVDLARNDLGRVCKYGSIQVDELMVVERYSHVMHLVSHVFGQLREGHNGFDVIRAVFPGGTITGVPKIHCMEIIEQLEPVRRGLYTGSIGFIGWHGNMDLNIVIRTLLLTKSCGYLQVGAGIVADSDPKREYEETLHKAQAFFHVLKNSSVA